MKFIVTQDGDEAIEVQGSVVFVDPYKNHDEFIVGMEFYSGRRKIYKILGCYKTEAVAKGVFSSVLGFLNLNSTNLFYMPKDKE